MDDDLGNRVAVVLGGTSGIGKAAALRFARSGAAVVFQGRNAEAAADIVAACGDAAVTPVFAPADIYDYDAIAGVMQTAVDRFGKLDILYASGGTSQPKAKLFQEIQPEEIPGYFQSRAFHRINAVHSAIPHMKAQGYGKIISLVTDAGRMPTPSESLIGAAAASIIFLTRALARELSRFGVRVNAISTSLTTDTGPYQRFQQARDAGSDNVLVKAFAKIEARAPFGLNSPEDLAELALFLASPASDKISGATISMNGGISFPQY